MPSDITNSTLAQKINDLIDLWRTRELQMVAWMTGAAGGGDLSDGTYPLSDYLGNVTYVKSPAELAAEVTTTVDSAVAQAAAASASASSASAAQVAAQTARDLALSYQTGAQSARDMAQSYSNNAADSASNAAFSESASAASASNAAASAAAAATSATASASSATAAAGSASAASTSATNAASSATAAAASAVAAATFTPALYALLASTNTFAAAQTINGLLTVGSNYSDSGMDHSALRLANASINAQTPIDFYTNGSLSGRIRNDYIGNLSYVTIGGGTHDFWIGGDSGTGFIALAIGPSFATVTPGYGFQLTHANATDVNDGKVGVGLFGSGLNIVGTQTTLGAGRQIRTFGDLIMVQGGIYQPNGLAISDQADGWLRLNNAGSFTKGTYTPGYFAADAGYTNSARTNFMQPNNGGFGLSYGTWYVNGGPNGYAGIALGDGGGRYPTFMAAPGTSGVYNQGPAYWSWRDDGSSFHIGKPPVVEGGNGVLYYEPGSGSANAFVVVRTTGPSGPANEGSLWFQRAA